MGTPHIDVATVPTPIEHSHGFDWTTTDAALVSALHDYVRHVEQARLLPLFERAQAGASERAFLQLPKSVVPCEAWLIRWPVKAVAPLHDHGSAHGVAQIVSGALYESRFRSNGGRTHERRWSEGVAIALPRGTCHEVSNLEAEVAYSVHVYAPRLELMTFYDRDATGRLRAMRQEVATEWRSGTRT